MNAEQESVVLAMDRGTRDVRLIRSTLEKAGFQVWTSSEDSNVLRLCSSNQGVRLVIIDTSAPGIHAAELAEDLLRIKPGIRILLLDGQDEPETERALTANVCGKLGRPFRRAQLLGSVLRATAPTLSYTA